MRARAVLTQHHGMKIRQVMQIRPIRFSDFAERAQELARDHWQETEAGFSSKPPELDVAAYLMLEQAGSLLLLGAFEGGALVGYSAVTLCRHPHYGFPCAFHDGLFLAREHRNGLAGVRLIRATEAEAKARGAQGISWHAKIGSQFEALIGRLGARPVETVFWKEL